MCVNFWSQTNLEFLVKGSMVCKSNIKYGKRIRNAMGDFRTEMKPIVKPQSEIRFFVIYISYYGHSQIKFACNSYTLVL